VLGELRDKISHGHSAELASIISAIDYYVSRNQPDIVILEAEEPGNLMFISTSNEELIDEIKSPVLLVPNDIEFSPFNRIVYATAYNEKDIIALRDLFRITAELNTSIKILHVNTEAGSGEQMGSLDFADSIRKQTNNTDISLENLSSENNESVTDLINDYASSVNANLIVVLRDERKFFDRLFKPDRTKKLVKKTDLPVLIYKV
jgi:nucleotide-binding universal stress UspA family protein